MAQGRIGPNFFVHRSGYVGTNIWWKKNLPTKTPRIIIDNSAQESQYTASDADPFGNRTGTQYSGVSAVWAGPVRGQSRDGERHSGTITLRLEASPFNEHASSADIEGIPGWSNPVPLKWHQPESMGTYGSGSNRREYFDIPTLFMTGTSSPTFQGHWSVSLGFYKKNSTSEFAAGVFHHKGDGGRIFYKGGFTAEPDVSP